MSRLDKPRLGILLGDACGVGPELIAKLCEKDRLKPYCEPVIIGDKRILERGREIIHGTFQIETITSVSQLDTIAQAKDTYYILDQQDVDPEQVPLGQVNARAGKAAGDGLILALELCKDNQLNGFAFAPLNKASLKAGGYTLESENKLFGQYFEREDLTCEVNVLDNLWTSRVTSHIPIKDVAAHLNEQTIFNAIKLAHDTLVFAGNETPRIGVAALNPHGGENGTCGREEIDVIQPALEKAKAKKINAVGPYPADILFIKAFNGDFDAAVTMYHDQGQIALKLKGFQYGVTVHANLPVAIATAAHGSAFDIAGKGVVTTDAMENAIKMTASLAIGLKKKVG